MDFEIDDVAFTTRRWHTGEVTGIVFCFHGKGEPPFREQMDWHEWEWTRAGALVVFPYLGPWSWMNPPARGTVDRLIEKIYLEYRLLDDVPLIMTGNSMGGLGALLCTRHARRPVAACAVAMPTCDLAFHYASRLDVRRSVISTFYGCGMDVPTLLAEQSPLSHVAHMPSIPYFFMHGDADKTVIKELHSDPMVAAMRGRGLQVEYLEAPGVGHEEPPQYKAQRIEWVKRFL